MFRLHKCEPVRGRFKVQNVFGLHVRPATRICEIATSYPETTVKIAQESIDYFVDAKSILGILTVAAPKDTVYIVEACGPQASEVISAIQKASNDMFGCHDE